jgi:RNA polymerase sigma-70 factor (ECF subfamily)
MELLVDAPDEELLRAGDTAGLVRRYYGPVYGLAKRLLGDAAEARDAAQETFARALAHLPEFDPARSFRSWVFAIAANYVRDLLRKRKALSLGPELHDALPELRPPDEKALRAENRERLRAAVEALPFDLKVAVVLHFQHELPPAEVAAVLGVTPNAVRIRLYRALAVLRKEITP